MTVKARRSRGNVFADLGFHAREAAHLRVRSGLMSRLAHLIAERGMTQAQAAALMGVSQPRVSDLMRGRIDRFRIDSLVQMLGRCGLDVHLTARPGPKVA